MLQNRLLGFMGLLPCCGWLPYALLPSTFLSLARLAPSVMSMRGGVENPNDLATLTKSSLCTSNTDRSEWDAYECRYAL